MVADNDLGWLSGTRSTLRNTGTQINAARLASLPGQDYAISAPWADANAPSTPAEASEPSGVVNAEKSEDPLFVGGFDSCHAGGIAVFAFGDGAVRALSDDMDARAYQQMGHRSDGELRLDSPW